MVQPPTWALVASNAVRYCTLRPWQPRLSLDGSTEPLPQRVKRLRDAWQQSRLSDGKRAADFNIAIFEAAFHRAATSRLPADPILNALLEFGIELALQNDNVFDFPAIDLSRSLTALEAQHVTDQLIEVQTRIEHDNRIHDLFSEGLCALYAGLLDELPPGASETGPAPFAVPFYSVVDPATFVARLLMTFLHDLVPDTPDAIAALPFMHTRMRLWHNLLDVSRMTPEQVETAPHKIVAPKDCDLTPPEMVAAYLGGTPLAAFVETPLPFTIPMETRFEHMHIVGGAGHGKTQTLQHLIATDLASPDPPSLIIIDSHGDMLAGIERLALFDPTHGRLTKRLIIIDPEDVEHPPALNMFDMGSGRLASYTPAQREQVEAATIELYDYIFRALSADLTSKQGVAFAFVARLLLTMPGATIHTLRELMEDQSPSIDKSPFHDAIIRLDDTARAFFEAHFFTKAFVDTKRQIARRIYDFIRNKTFERMFSSPVNKLDMFEAMNSGAIVLVNTSKALLKTAASALFGRYMIALALRAAFERVAIPPEQRRPAFLIIDEAADYFDANVDALLTQVRKYKLGLVFAHQYLDQLDGALRASFAANTAIKFAGGVSDKDARALAPDMRCKSEFIAAQRKRDDHTTFAAYVRNLTPTALSLTVPFGTLDRQPCMSAAAQLLLRERNRQRYATRLGAASASPPQNTSAGPAPAADDDEMDVGNARVVVDRFICSSIPHRVWVYSKQRFLFVFLASNISRCYTSCMSTLLSSPLTISRRKRRFVRETPDPFQLTQRDITLVGLVAQHRFLRSTHLSELCQAPHKKVCDRLTSLFHAGYVDRPRAQFDHYREGGGSSPMVYALGNRGAQLLIQHHGPELAQVDWARKNDLAGRQFIQHTLAIADVRVALKSAIHTRPGYQLLEPRQLLEAAPEETQRRERPWTWRSKVHYNDTTIELGVAPDYPFAVQYPDGRFRVYLVECDRGTMPVDRANLAQTSLKRKFLAYTAAKRADLHQRHFGWKAFRVLVVTTNKQRGDNVLATIRACVHEHGRGLFLIADRQSLATADIISYPWCDARGQTHALV